VRGAGLADAGADRAADRHRGVGVDAIMCAAPVPADAAMMPRPVAPAPPPPASLLPHNRIRLVMGSPATTWLIAAISSGRAPNILASPASVVVRPDSR